MFITSAVIAAVLFHVVRYRRRVVKENIARSFPEKTDAWHKRVQKGFYHNFSLVFHEMMHFTRYSSEEMLKRVRYENPELLHSYSSRNRNLMIVTGHCGNWELLGLTLPLATKVKTFAAAIKQSDLYFNRAIDKMRTRFGLEIIPSGSIYRSLLKRGGEPFAVFLIADQTPPRHELDHWTVFLNQDTPVFLGPENIARKMDLVVVFAAMERTECGRYSVAFRLVADKPAELLPYHVTDKHTEMLNELISSNPESWLWSHRRWKHKKPVMDVEQSSG